MTTSGRRLRWPAPSPSSPSMRGLRVNVDELLSTVRSGSRCPSACGVAPSHALCHHLAPGAISVAPAASAGAAAYALRAPAAEAALSSCGGLADAAAAPCISEKPSSSRDAMESIHWATREPQNEIYSDKNQTGVSYSHIGKMECSPSNAKEFPVAPGTTHAAQKRVRMHAAATASHQLRHVCISARGIS